MANSEVIARRAEPSNVEPLLAFLYEHRCLAPEPFYVRIHGTVPSVDG